MIVACGLELRITFLAHFLVEVALRTPQRFHSLGKGLLRQAFAGLFSSGSLNRPKQGFVLLMASWISQHCRAFGTGLGACWRWVRSPSGSRCHE